MDTVEAQRLLVVINEVVESLRCGDLVQPRAATATTAAEASGVVLLVLQAHIIHHAGGPYSCQPLGRCLGTGAARG